MTILIAVAVALILGAVIGLGIALKVFGVDTECQRRIHKAWDAGYEMGFYDAEEDRPWSMSAQNPHPSGDPRE